MGAEILNLDEYREKKDSQEARREALATAAEALIRIEDLEAEIAVQREIRRKALQSIGMVVLDIDRKKREHCEDPW